ncbi:hypothetical protein CEXT_187281 [Caerostris extrusa]|uniref:Uncharacterized protein n=1 Tax=Caerostris extrusa TaxID=172846 RepID=A0AAV4VRN2_CAEEX|nr:hypothetical protein CEXT_187281 [Caerostris extrusa]
MQFRWPWKHVTRNTNECAFWSGFYEWPGVMADKIKALGNNLAAVEFMAAQGNGKPLKQVLRMEQGEEGSPALSFPFTVFAA